MDGWAPSHVGAYRTVGRSGAGRGSGAAACGRPMRTIRLASNHISSDSTRSSAAGPATNTRSYALSWFEAETALSLSPCPR